MPNAAEDHPHLSLVIPAYNEARRLEASLRAALTFLDEQPYSTELILVDDGSTDGTTGHARLIIGDRPDASVLTTVHGGKARAVRAGMLAARGELIAFSDIDLATPLEYLDDLRAAVLQSCEIAIASREGIGAHRVDEPMYRHVMGRLFNLLVRLTVLPGIDDTQCGFKMFRRDAARNILARARLYTDPAAKVSGPRVTAFDVEMLVIAKRQGYRVCPIPVVWTAGEQSKVSPIRDTLQNFSDVMHVRLHDWRGHYS
ncbi:MAG TPA: dolichyl-phosphate beta-glucosyltransferase [Thermomicrobiales bacterium]|nr:dolichyl-phosphate beta-glucosyltransferase [Thermomicrobiales bacterium]